MKKRSLSKKEIMVVADKRAQTIESTLEYIQDQLFMILTLIIADEDERAAIIEDIKNANRESDQTNNESGEESAGPGEPSSDLGS